MQEASKPLIADIGIPNNEVTTNVTEADNPDSASATITITWTTAYIHSGTMSEGGE